MVCKSLAVITPVQANTAMGSMATVLALMPTCFPNTQSRMVRIMVTATTLVRQLCFTSPSIFSSMVFWVKGKKVFTTIQATTSITITMGAITIIQSAKVTPKSMPVGSLSTL